MIPQDINKKIIEFIQTNTELKNKISKNLSATVFVNLLNRVADNLNENEKSELRAGVKNPDELMQKLLSFVPDDRLEKLINESVIDVAVQFNARLMTH